MKILVGWYHPATGRLVNIPAFDHVEDTVGWFPAVVDVPQAQIYALLASLAQLEPQ